MSEATVDLGLIAHQQRQLIDQMAILRDDMPVLIAIVRRFDGTVAGLANEIRATHAQQSRLDRRVPELEGKISPTDD